LPALAMMLDQPAVAGPAQPGGADLFRRPYSVAWALGREAARIATIAIQSRRCDRSVRREMRSPRPGSQYRPDTIRRTGCTGGARSGGRWAPSCGASRPDPAADDREPSQRSPITRLAAPA
jgi:hypothetical protein